MNLIGLAELAELYSVSKNTANTWARRHDWPAPVATLKMGPVWDREEILRHKPVEPGEWISDKSGTLKLRVGIVKCPTCGSPKTLADGTLQIVQLALGPYAAIWSTCDNCGSAQALIPLPKEGL